MRKKLHALVSAFLLAYAPLADAQQVVPISNLPTAATPLTGSEYVPCVQGGLTKKCVSSSLIGASAVSFVAASDFGVSTTNGDNSAYFNAIDAAGKVAVLSPGIYNVASTITFTHSYTGIRCASATSGIYSNVAAPAGGCWLKWTGANGGRIMSIIAPTGSTSDSFLSGNTVEGINFEGSGIAADALYVASEEHGRFDHLYGQNFNGGNVFTWTVVQATPTNWSADPCDTQFNEISNIAVNQFNGSSNAYLFGAWTNPAIGNNGCNFSNNTVSDLQAAVHTGEGLVWQGIDNNVFYNTRVYSVGGAIGVDIGFSTAGGVQASNSNTMYGVSAIITARGQATQPGCTAYTGSNVAGLCTFGNILYGLDKGNGSPDPTRETNAQVIWYNTDGTNGPNQMSSALAIGDSYAAQEVARQNIGNSNLTLVNGNAANLVIADEGFATSWTLNTDSTSGANANLQIRSAGAGHVQITNPLELNGSVVGAWQAYTPASAPTPGSGAFTTVSYTNPQYSRVNRTIYFQAPVTVTNVGTATGCLTISLPVASASTVTVGLNAENIATGTPGTGYIGQSATTATVCSATGAALLTTGGVVVISGFYQAAS